MADTFETTCSVLQSSILKKFDPDLQVMLKSWEQTEGDTSCNYNDLLELVILGDMLYDHLPIDRWLVIRKLVYKFLYTNSSDVYQRSNVHILLNWTTERLLVHKIPSLHSVTARAILDGQLDLYKLLPITANRGCLKTVTDPVICSWIDTLFMCARSTTVGDLDHDLVQDRLKLKLRYKYLYKYILRPRRNLPYDVWIKTITTEINMITMYTWMLLILRNTNSKIDKSVLSKFVSGCVNMYIRPNLDLTSTIKS